MGQPLILHLPQDDAVDRGAKYPLPEEGRPNRRRRSHKRLTRTRTIYSPLLLFGAAVDATESGKRRGRPA